MATKIDGHQLTHPLRKILKCVHASTHVHTHTHIRQCGKFIHD